MLLGLECQFNSCAIYQFSLPWQELAQERDVAFQPMVVVRFLTPLLCVAEFTVVVLKPEPWQVAQAILRLVWKACSPVAGGMAWQLPHAVVVGGGVVVVGGGVVVVGATASAVAMA